MIKKFKNTIPWTYKIENIYGKKICRNVLYEKVLKNKSNKV